ncbi:hypothetical protein SBRCBS47491_001663 [Sporothrix bragantina]|uniref:Uncharacterized protein n=1 Tax=Sporothrix bragantina TaxID=671064 RepID=A0ABP0B0F7_9PEZI
MVQRKIDFYLGRPPQRPIKQDSISFLHLPYNIRRRIYILAGLVRFCPINLNQEGIRSGQLCTGAKTITGYACFYVGRRFLGNTFGIEDVPVCECPPLPVALLYVSHAISDEVSQILYSENSFTISRSDVWGLRPLQNLGSHAVASLHRLTIRLNNSECVFALRFHVSHSIPPCHPLCVSHGMHDAPLSISTRQGKAVIRQWETVLAKVAVNVQPGQLRLDFVCDTGDVATAEHIAKLLNSSLPLLRDCSIRLRLRPDWTHHMLAYETAQSLLRQPPLPPTKAYSYYLPSEIITRILEFSELVAARDLEWRPDGGFAPYDCCTRCTTTLDCCTCRRFHGSYSTSCKCWTPPVALFLVSRRVHDLAMDVFYGRNRFVVMPKGGRLDLETFEHCAPGLPRRSLLEPFLAAVPEQAHKRIRFLGLLIPPFATGTVLPGPQDKRTLAWGHTLRLLQERLNLPQLQLSIYCGGMYYCRLHPDNSAMLATHANVFRLVLGDLPCVHGLRDLFLFLQWNHDIQDTDMDGVAATLERVTMGSSYDSAKRGKWKNWPRIWYAGVSKEGNVYAPDGRRVWPFYDEDDNDNLSGRWQCPLGTYTYVYER